MTAPHQINYHYEPVPTCERFSKSNAFMRGLMGPYGSGKSSACVVEIINRGLAQTPGPDGVRRTRWAVIRNTYSELSLTTIKTFMAWAPEMYFGRYVENKHTYTITAFAGTVIEVIFLALDRPEDIKKLLSLELTGAWVNEAREVPWSVIEVLQARVGRYPAIREGGPTWHGLILDTNPPDSDSKWFKYFEEKNWLKDFKRLQVAGDIPAEMRPEEFAQIFKQPGGLTPHAENIENLPGGRRYYTNMSAGKAPEWIKVYVDGEYGFVVEGKLVYPEYSDQVHCKKVDPVEGVTVIRGWDFGLTPACTFSQLLPDGRWLTFDEMTSDNMSIDQFGDEVIEHCNRAFKGRATFEDWGDPAGAIRAETDKRSSFDMLRAKNIDIQPAMTNEPMLRQEAVRKPLRTLTSGEPQFILHPRCIMLRKGFMGGYHRRRMQTAGPERYSEKPEKNQYSHCFPAGIMVSTPAGSRPIEDVRLGDLVHTPLGPRRVTATMTRIAPQLVDVETRDGRLLPCTPEHPIWNDRSFCRADALQYGDRLLTSEPWDARPSIRSKSSRAFATIESPPATTKPTRGITSIATSGGPTMAPFQMVGTSTTRTRTAPTARSTTSNACRTRSMRRSMAASVITAIQSAAGGTWRPFVRSPQRGTAPMRGAPGIRIMLARWLRRCQWSTIVAFGAMPSTRLSVALGSAAIALPPASPRRGALLASMTNSGHAPSAPNPSRSTATRVPEPADAVARVSWRAPQMVRVYDLTVEDAHAFYANGILVSNCHDALQYPMVQYFAPAMVGADDSSEDDFFDRPSYGVEATRNETTGY